jgi:Mn2+/Fe2+ NRAMP family transporter
VAQSDSGTGRKARPAGPFRRFLAVLGPGLIAGASDNDPTTVATLAVIGAATGYALAWLILLILPMLLVVQVVSARLGLVSRKSMEGLIRERWGNGWAVLAMALVLIVNLFTIGADLEGGAAALGLLTRLDWKWFVLPLAALLGALLTFGTFKQVERVLRYVLLVFLAYLVAAIGAHPDWPDVIHHTLIPSFQFTAEYTAAALALLGTTLTDYVYVWQTIEMEEAHPSLNELPLVQLDAAAGIVTTVLLFWSIVVSTGAT